MQKVDFFSHPFPHFTCQVKLTGLGLASICQPWASEEDSEKIIQPSIRKRRGDKGKGLSCSLDGAFSCQVPRLATAVAVDFTCLAAVDGNVTGFTTPKQEKSQLI